MSAVGVFICVLLQVAMVLIIAHIVFSWVPSPPTPLVPVIRFVRGLVEPVLAPLRRIMPPVQLGAFAFDTAVLVLIIIIVILEGVFGCGQLL